MIKLVFIPNFLDSKDKISTLPHCLDLILFTLMVQFLGSPKIKGELEGRRQFPLPTARQRAQ
jgi:hypothetical protein